MLPAIEYQLAPSPNLPAQPNWQQVAADYPWYPVAHWQQALAGDSAAAGRLFSFVQQPLRCHILLSPPAAEHTSPTLPAETFAPVITDEEAPSVVPTNTTTEAEAELLTKTTEPAQREPAADTVAHMDAAPAATSAAEAERASELRTTTVTTNTDEAVADNDALLFQPYHTVDYFASLGIKIDPSLPTNSQFDRQLKSFTQWLKTMKRMNYQTGQFSDDPQVTRQAAESLHKEPVITAAMAEVLARQGLKAQAIDLYRKLSLLHPEKSAFFASQIEKLTQ
jgi:hypothetical protein